MISLLLTGTGIIAAITGVYVYCNKSVRSYFLLFNNSYFKFSKVIFTNEGEENMLEPKIEVRKEVVPALACSPPSRCLQLSDGTYNYEHLYYQDGKTKSEAAKICAEKNST